MQVTVKCDIMTDGWNYTTCPSCKRFRTKAGPDWRCMLNNGSAKERRTFYTIWALNYLNYRGGNFAEDEVIVDYVGKRKPK